MNTRKAVALAAPASWDPLVLWSSLLDLPRQESSVTAHVGSELFNGIQHIAKVQQAALHEALEQYTAAARKLQKRCAPLDVLAVQMDLANANAQAAASYWQGVTDAVLQMQARLVACGCEMLDADKVLEACAMFEKP